MWDLEGGVVDQDVEPAEFGRHPVHRLETEGPVAHVAGDQQTAAAFLLHRPGFGRLSILSLVQIEDGDIGAFAGEEHGHGPPDAGIARR